MTRLGLSTGKSSENHDFSSLNAPDSKPNLGLQAFASAWWALDLSEVVQEKESSLGASVSGWLQA